MKGVTRHFARAARYCGSVLLSFLLWTFWLGLLVLMIAQIYVAATNELSVPGFILHPLQAQLADTGLKMTFDRATFDPTGRILVQSPRVFMPGIPDPIVTARAVYVGLDPWRLWVGKLEVRELRLIDGKLQVPAMLSPSGRSEPIVNDIDALLVPGDSELAIRHVTARVSGMLVSVHGAIATPPSPPRPSGELEALLRARFRELCRRSGEITRTIEAFDDPALAVRLVPSATRGAIVSAELEANRLKLETPVAVQLEGLRAVARLPLLGNIPGMSVVRFEAKEVRLPNEVRIDRLTAFVRARIQPAASRFDPVAIEMAAGAVVAAESSVQEVHATLKPLASGRWHGDATVDFLGAPLHLAGDIDPKEHRAGVDFRGAIAPQVVDLIGARTHVDLRRFFAFDAMYCDQGSAEFGPEWRFQRLSAKVKLGGISAYGIRMDEGAATIELDPHRLYAPEAYARIGENFARGSYTHIFATRGFRFLLDGRLRPLDISGWFHEWWPNFFDRFQFPSGPPVASVDVQGIWRDGRDTSVFVFVDASDPSVHGQSLRSLRTRLFVRPGFYDGLEVHAVDRDGGLLNGTFTVVSNLDSEKLATIDVDARSTVAFAVAQRIGGALAAPILEPFSLTQPPAVTLHGHFDGPAVEGPRHRSMDLQARTSGPFRFYGFPFQDVGFDVVLRDDDISINDITGRFAGGAVRAHAKVWGSDADRRIGFDASVTDASLGSAVSTLQEFAAARKGQPPPAPGKFVKEKTNVRMDLAASAVGLYGNQLSFHGDGNAMLRGAEIGEVPIFGPLSELLKFTALRFTTAHAVFKIDGPKVEFSNVALRGANSAIDAHGDYALDRHELDFRAKVFPFQQSDSVIKSVVGAVLSPISNVLEVKLTGTLEKPDWAFVIGPTNFLRALAPNQTGATENAKPGPVTPTAAAAQPTAPSPTVPSSQEAKPPPAGAATKAPTGAGSPVPDKK